MTGKEFYTSPEVKVFNVRIEGVICGSLRYGNTGEAGGDFDFNNLGDF